MNAIELAKFLLEGQMLSGNEQRTLAQEVVRLTEAVREAEVLVELWAERCLPCRDLVAEEWLKKYGTENGSR